MGEYVLICPVCGWEVMDTYKSMFSQLKVNMSQHVMFDDKHRKVVANWFKNNKKNWNYVRREVVRILKSGEPVAFTIVKAYRPLGSEKLAEELGKIRDPEDFIEKLFEYYKEAEERRSTPAKDVDEAFQREADFLALQSLVYWIGVYWVGHNLLKVDSREKVPEKTDKVVYIEDTTRHRRRYS